MKIFTILDSNMYEIKVENEWKRFIISTYIADRKESIVGFGDTFDEALAKLYKAYNDLVKVVPIVADIDAYNKYLISSLRKERDDLIKSVNKLSKELNDKDDTINKVKTELYNKANKIDQLVDFSVAYEYHSEAYVGIDAPLKTSVPNHDVCLIALQDNSRLAGEVVSAVLRIDRIVNSR